jgi:hypothetical protein
MEEDYPSKEIFIRDNKIQKKKGETNKEMPHPSEVFGFKEEKVSQKEVGSN